MAIFLTVLKITGIVLLSILGLILFLLLLILFVPVRYRIQADGSQPEKRYEGNVDVTWLLHLLHASAFARNGEEKFGYTVKVLGFRILPRKAGKEEPEDSIPEESGAGGDDIYQAFLETEQGAEGSLFPEDAESTGEEMTGGTGTGEAGTGEAESGQTAAGEAGTGNAETGEAVSGEEAAGEAAAGVFEGAVQQDPEEDFEDDIYGLPLPKKVRAFISMLRRLFDRSAAVFRNLRYTIEKLCDRIKQLAGRAAWYRDFFTDPRSQEAIALVLREVFGILKSLIPRKWDAYLHIGTGDPAKTGEMCGAAAALQAMTGNRFRLEPDFVEKTTEGSLFMKGHFRIFTALTAAWKLFFNRNLRRFIKILRRGAPAAE